MFIQNYLSLFEESVFTIPNVRHFVYTVYQMMFDKILCVFYFLYIIEWHKKPNYFFEPNILVFWTEKNSLMNQKYFFWIFRIFQSIDSVLLVQEINQLKLENNRRILQIKFAWTSKMKYADTMSKNFILLD